MNKQVVRSLETMRFTPYLICSCGCGDHATVDESYWVGNYPYKDKTHAEEPGIDICPVCGACPMTANCNQARCDD